MKIIKRINLLIIICTIVISCNQSGKAIHKEYGQTLNTKAKQNQKLINLDFGFKLIVGQEEELEKVKIYSYLKLIRYNTNIYIDSLLTDYEFGNKLFPKIFKTGNNSFEVLIEVNNRPNKNYLKRLYIKDNKLLKQDVIPTFESNPIDINNDGIKEYAGYWDYSQVWGYNNNITAYNPILYYSITPNGLLLDSLLTKQRNEMIYGGFYGFSFSEKHEQPAIVIEKFKKELELINRKP